MLVPGTWCPHIACLFHSECGVVFTSCHARLWIDLWFASHSVCFCSPNISNWNWIFSNWSWNISNLNWNISAPVIIYIILSMLDLCVCGSDTTINTYCWVARTRTVRSYPLELYQWWNWTRPCLDFVRKRGTYVKLEAMAPLQLLVDDLTLNYREKPSRQAPITLKCQNKSGKNKTEQSTWYEVRIITGTSYNLRQEN